MLPVYVVHIGAVGSGGAGREKVARGVGRRAGRDATALTFLARGISPRLSCSQARVFLGGPRNGPHTRNRSERPGEAGALRCNRPCSMGDQNVLMSSRSWRARTS